MSLAGQVAIVAGAGRGIGRAIALELAGRGMSVVLASRTRAQLEETAALIQEAGGTGRVSPADVTDRAAVQQVVGDALAAFGQVDLLVNDAGSYQAIGPVWEVDPERWWRDVTTNVLGTFLTCRAVLPLMIERRRGKIINLSGGGAVAPFPYGSGYGTSKAAVVRFSDTLQLEVREHGIKVYAMGPGLVRTELTEYQLTAPEGQKYLSRIRDMFANGVDVPPERAAALAAFLASPAGDPLAGRVIGVADDWEGLARRGDELTAGDLYTLRLRR